MNPKLPPPVWALIRALWLPSPAAESCRLLSALDQEAWKQALDFADRTQLTLVVWQRLLEGLAWENVPPETCRRLKQNLTDNTDRVRRIEAASAEIADRFIAAGVDFLVLKGLSHSPSFGVDARLRVQYDIDYYCPPKEIHRARNILLDLDYEPLAEHDEVPRDHLAPMARKTGWQWRGNYFDPEIPLSIDLHFRFWDPETERLPATGVGEFWERRVERAIDGRRVFELEPADRLAYAALHSLKHLLRGSLRLYHIYEVACFLHNRKEDAEFWARRNFLHSTELRRLESVVFLLAEKYFGARTPGESLPQDVMDWFDRYGWSPVEALVQPNKHELFLHLSMLHGWQDNWKVLRRRLLPARLPGHVEAVMVPKQEMTIRLWFRKWVRYFAWLASRFYFHARLLLPTLWALARWQFGRRR